MESSPNKKNKQTNKLFIAEQAIGGQASVLAPGSRILEKDSYTAGHLASERSTHFARFQGLQFQGAAWIKWGK